MTYSYIEIEGIILYDCPYAICPVGKKKKKKEPPPPPPVGPWIFKLHINDNGIDGMAYGKEFAPLEFIRDLKKYAKTTLQETCSL